MTRSVIKNFKCPCSCGAILPGGNPVDLLFISGQIPLDPEYGELAGTLF